ncbi:alkaline phosphatase family protein, partial [Brevirhabdus pacifica]
EILSAIVDPAFDHFPTATRPELVARLGMADYSERHDAFFDTVFPKHEVENTLGAWVAAKGLTQFHIAETEKYPHVTFFLNGGREEPEPGEDRHMPASPDVPTYDLRPEMSSVEVADHLVAAVRKGYDLVVVNFANPDMVGHTGSISAATRACEAVDVALGRLIEATRASGGALLVTADHGNCELMVDPETGKAHTAHTLNPVPVLLDGGPEGARLADGRLADLAPTVLELMGLTPPPEMTGKSLIR